MPMGIVSDAEFEKELHINGSKSTDVVTIDKPGRKSGDKNVPEVLRKIIGEEATINGRQEALALARSLGVSSSSVSAYANGAHSTDSYHKSESKLTEYLRNRKNRITKKAMNKLVSALDQITPEKLSEVKTSDVAKIARDMSAIVKNMEDTNKGVTGDQQNNQFIFYAPQFMNEERYDTVEVRE